MLHRQQMALNFQNMYSIGAIVRHIYCLCWYLAFLASFYTWLIVILLSVVALPPVGAFLDRAYLPPPSRCYPFNTPLSLRHGSPFHFT
jgi:hypothetical protein